MKAGKIWKRLSGAAVAITLMTALCACGGPKWEGTYGGTSTSGSKVEITIEKDGTAAYNENGDVEVGTWTEHENSISLDFGGAVSSCEPLIVTLSSDENMITVESDRDLVVGREYDHRRVGRQQLESGLLPEALAMIRGNENVIRWFVRLVRRDMEASPENEAGKRNTYRIVRRRLKSMGKLGKH